MGTAVNLFSLKNYYKIVVPYRAKTICRKFKTCFLKKVPNVKYSWGISGILNQNSVNSEFVKWRPRISQPPFFAFFMWDYFPLQGNITIFANITPKNNLPFRSTFIYLINRYFFYFSDSMNVSY